MSLPNALEELKGIEESAQGKRLAVFLDYDGTLTPIVERPELAVLAPEMRKAVEALAAKCVVGVISGRQLDSVRAMMGMGGIPYAGDHGYRMLMADGTEIDLPEAEPYRQAAHKAADELEKVLNNIPGALVERKDYSLAVHYRAVAEKDVDDFHGRVREVVPRYPQLKFSPGKMIYDVKPAMNWHKGRAVEKFLEVLGLAGGGVLPLYLGDDTTDEDAFRALKERGNGLGIFVGEAGQDSAAAYSLRNVDEVREFMEKLSDLC